MALIHHGTLPFGDEDMIGEGWNVYLASDHIISLRIQNILSIRPMITRLLLSFHPVAGLGAIVCSESNNPPHQRQQTNRASCLLASHVTQVRSVFSEILSSKTCLDSKQMPEMSPAVEFPLFPLVPPPGSRRSNTQILDWTLDTTTSDTPYFHMPTRIAAVPHYNRTMTMMT